MTPRHRHGGLRKFCPCSIRNWAKCPHAWQFNFRHRGRDYRFSLDRRLGRRITSKTEAEAEATRIRLAIRDGLYDTKPDDGVAADTLEGYAREWLRTTKLNLKTSTVKFYTAHLERSIFPLLGSRPIDSITRADVRQLIAVSRESGTRTKTVAGLVRTLSTVLTQAVEDGRLPANPALRPGKYLRQADEPAHEADPLTREHAAHLLSVAEQDFPEWFPWLLCALRTGMRIGELIGLEWGDIDWRRPSPSILVQRAIVYGKITTPKNHQRRKIDLSDRLRRTLGFLRQRQIVAALKDGTPRPTRVFVNAAGNALDPSNVRKVLHRILDKAGLRHRRIHDLRHTFASLLIQQGEPLAYVQKQMGHASIQITVDVYGKWEPGGNREAVDRLDAAVAHSLRRSA